MPAVRVARDRESYVPLRRALTRHLGAVGDAVDVDRPAVAEQALARALAISEELLLPQRPQRR
jgi:hypothetical protein